MNRSALLIEDDVSSLFIMAGLLEKEGFRTYKASSYNEAMALIDAEYDIIVCDLNLPDGNGLDIIAAIKKLNIHRHTPVMCVTASNKEKDVKTAFQFGACDYVVKPIWFTVFTEKVGFLVTAKQNAKQLELASTHDSLTGLLNRRGLAPLAGQIWQHAFRNKTPVAAFFVDIDNFKCINDTYGHDFGDRCIVGVAGVLHDKVRRETDLIARYGGDEFIVLLPNTEASVAMDIANTVCEAIKSSSVACKSGATASITATIGVASMIPEVNTPLSQLLDLADVALLKAKQCQHKGQAQLADSAASHTDAN